ncbi:atp-grasp fold duf201-type [Lucifera butyrica]|uniref:Atp-grasp fold duf201-type n=1 Tax=Lucifera butyrica TaxID=1351585 RepID=A0A498R8S8_9FIRM|nr:ATP-grasp domain-containing protein [Lucifera butyrica]VBB05538.1 atp-grasp fold duf201-type [Lucifera butyrica]
MYKILTEASGSMTAAYLIKAVQSAGCLAVASDIDENCAGRFLADDFLVMPAVHDPQLWEKITKALLAAHINVVIPSLDETLLAWAQQKERFRELGIYVMLSEPDTVRRFQDKWLAYNFFREIGVPTPATGLEQKYPLVKPRHGRGSQGIKITDNPIDMDGMISQELIEGEEYTVDVFCDRDAAPVYIIPRRRIAVKEGKSTGGQTVYNKEIIMWIRKICREIPFLGPVNFQCFVCADGSVRFIEINPRIAGGMALGFAASENWVKLMIHHFIQGEAIIPKPVQYGLEMRRYYAEVFIPSS